MEKLGLTLFSVRRSISVFYLPLVTRHRCFVQHKGPLPLVNWAWAACGSKRNAKNARGWGETFFLQPPSPFPSRARLIFALLVLIKKPENDLLPTFSPDFTWNRQIWLFYAEKWIFFKNLGTLLNPFAPGDFAEKTCFEASRVVFWSLSCYKELKLTTNRFTGRTLRGLLIQMQNISLRSSGKRRKQNFEGLKVTQQSWLLLFAFSPPLFFRFSCLIFFLLLGI